MAPRATGAEGIEGRLADLRRMAGTVADITIAVLVGADAVMRQAGFTTRDGRISKGKLVLAALRPRSSGLRLIRAAVIEIDRRRNGPVSRSAAGRGVELDRGSGSRHSNPH
jgi:hypothetical protein